jgi:endonuclease III
MGKTAFDIDLALERIGAAVQPYPKAAMFQLAEEGFSSLYEQLVGCILSIRTYDEQTIPIARRLFARARTPQAMLTLTPAEVDALITPSTFHERKALQILRLSRRILDEFAGELPCDEETLLSFNGVGIKCAHLALGVACGREYISVDVHVHRITNRWGYVQTTTPERTTLALEQKLPRRHWIEINRLLVPFGKHICTGTLPRCSTCPLLDMCPQIGVTGHR